MANHDDIKVSLYRQPPGRFANWFALGNRFTLPPGKKYLVSPPQNYPDSTYLDNGATHIGLNWGTAVVEYVPRVGTPASKLGYFLANCSWIKEFRPNKHFNDWTMEEVDQFAANRINYPGLPNMLVLTGESSGADTFDNPFYWRPAMDFAPAQTKRMMQRFGEAMDAQGGWLFNEYSGALNTIAIFDTGQDTQYINALASPAAALSFMKANEEQWTKYFGARMWENMDCLVITYQMLAGGESYAFLYRAMARLAVCKLAMQDNEVTRKRRLWTFVMPQGLQSVFFNEDFVQTWPNGGSTFSNAFPLWSYPAQVFSACVEYMWADARYGWADCIRHGTDPDKFYDHQVVTGATSTVNRVGTFHYEYYNGDVGVNIDPQGYNNAQEDGARWYSLIWQHTGTTNWTTCRYRTVGGAYCDNDYAYIVRRYLENKPWAFLFTGVNGKKALLGYTSHTPDFITYQFDIGDAASPFEVNLPPGAPFLFLIP